MRMLIWKVAGALLAGAALLCLWIGVGFGWSVFQISRGNLGIAPGDWTKAISVPWVIVAGSFLTLFTLLLGFFAGWGAWACFRPGGMFQWRPRKTGNAPWWSELSEERRSRGAGSPGVGSHSQAKLGVCGRGEGTGREDVL